MRVKKGDEVVVLSGKYAGHRAEVIRALPATDQVVLDSVNIAKRHQKQVSETTLYRHAARNIRWAILGFIAGLVLLVLTALALISFDERGSAAIDSARSAAADVIQPVRSASSSAFNPVTDWIDGGVTVEESIAYAAELKAIGYDVVHCTSSGFDGAKIPVGPAFQAPFAAQIRREAALGAAALVEQDPPLDAEALGAGERLEVGDRAEADVRRLVPRVGQERRDRHAPARLPVAGQNLRDASAGAGGYYHRFHINEGIAPRHRDRPGIAVAAELPLEWPVPLRIDEVEAVMVRQVCGRLRATMACDIAGRGHRQHPSI